jgi:GNAT superfamily N-acetyltransferase
VVKARSDESGKSGSSGTFASVDVTFPAGTRPGRPPGVVRLRRMRSEDLDFVVRQHQTHFPEGFFARLGRGFLTEYYRPYLSSRFARASIADADGRPVGYLVGVTHPAAHRDYVLRTHGPALLLRAVQALLARPGLARSFLRTRARKYLAKALRQLRRQDPSTGQSAPRRIAVLDRVAVAPPARSQGIGSALIESFVAEAAQAGCARVHLVTADGDGGAAGYYESTGWQCCGEHRTPDGQKLLTYDRPVDGEQAAREPGH